MSVDSHSGSFSNAIEASIYMVSEKETCILVNNKSYSVSADPSSCSLPSALYLYHLVSISLDLIS